MALHRHGSPPAGQPSPNPQPDAAGAHRLSPVHSRAPPHPSSTHQLSTPVQSANDPAATSHQGPPSADRLPARPAPPSGGPQQPQEGPSRLPAGEPHQGRPTGLPQAAPGPSQGQRRGAWGEPCSHALGGRHHIARPEIVLKRADGRGDGKGASSAVPTPGSGGGTAAAVPGEVLGVVGELGEFLRNDRRFS